MTEFDRYRLMYSGDEIRVDAHARIACMRVHYMTQAEEDFWDDHVVMKLLKAMDDEAAHIFNCLPNEDVHWHFNDVVKEFFGNRCTFPDPDPTSSDPT